VIVRPVVYQLVKPAPCFDCGAFPCACRLPVPNVPIVSRACVCGGRIEAPNIWQAIAHNASTVHEQWAIREGWR